MNPSSTPSRLAWVDIAKGLSIVLVVLMHATLGVEKAADAETLLGDFITWARPFRMPDFFLISGLFLAARIGRPWQSYLDTKVVHFAYFYVLWFTILYLLKAPFSAETAGAADLLSGYLWGFVEPYGSLWFIYLLAVFFVVTRLLEPVPRPIVLAAAALLHMSGLHTGTTLADEFASRFVFFYAGYIAAPLIFAYADRVERAPAAIVLAVLAVWALLNAAGVAHGMALAPSTGIGFAFAGIAAVIAVSVLLVERRAGQVLGYAGRHSIAAFLAFPLFIGPVRAVGLKLGLPLDVVSILSASAGLLGPLLMAAVVSGTRAAFLFERPNWARLGDPRKVASARTVARREAITRPLAPPAE